ncbi:MAG: hypothetical protein KGL12_15405, partial [Rhodospirillales bacterium]|nr:hypothetical protein [Rhodospirillales bacterium]
MALLPLVGMGIWLHRHATDDAVHGAMARDALVARDIAIELSDHIAHARAAFAAELALAPPAADAPAGPVLPAGAALAALRAGLDLRATCLLAPPDAPSAPGPCALAASERAA